MLVFTHDGTEGGAQDILVNADGKSSFDTVGEADIQATIYTTPWDNVRFYHQLEQWTQLIDSL